MKKATIYSTIMFLSLLCFTIQDLSAQTITIGPNQYAFQYSLNPAYGMFFNSTNASYELRNGSAAAIFSIDANTGHFERDIAFNGPYDLLIGGNRYAFRYVTPGGSKSNFGLYFNFSELAYQFTASNGSSLFHLGTNGKLGIGTTTPDYALDVAGNAGIDGSLRHNDDDNTMLRFGIDEIFLQAGGQDLLNVFEGPNDHVEILGELKVAPGQTAVFGDDTVGSGTRFSWQATKGAIRAGTLFGASNFENWNYDSIGYNSAAFNYNTKARGDRSTAFGNNTYALGENSFAANLDSKAKGANSGAFGNATVAGGSNSLSGGFQTTAGGDEAVAFGRNTNADAAASMVIGRWNVLGGNATAWVNTDPLFVIGIGTDNANRKNALTILKNGNTTVNGVTELIRDNGNNSISSVLDGHVIVGNRTGIHLTIDRDEIQAKTTTTNNNQTLFLNQHGGNVRVGTAAGAVLNVGSTAGAAIFVGDEMIKDNGTTTLEFNADLDPQTHLVRDQGSSTFAWDDIWADNFINTSDRRLKKDIQPLLYGLEEIMQLHPVSYTMKNDPQETTKLGLIAQEVLPVIEESVKTHDYQCTNEEANTYEIVELDYMGLDYSTLIPVLINAIQDQQKIIEQHESAIRNLLLQQHDDGKNLGTSKNESDSEKESAKPIMHDAEGYFLGQNVPNPFDGMTLIEYQIPDQSKNARISISSSTGKIIREFPLTNSKGNIRFASDELPGGIYIYSLISGDRIIQSHQMILSR